jgi:8-oxo-dGTP pyrophosphatase MutT (NUDIX family)
METCDVLDETGNRTGRTVTRGTKLAQGEYYSVVHVWIKNEAGEYLVQQRASYLDSDPGIWATTVGYVLAGEDSLSGAIREVSEELGIQLWPEHLRRLARHKMDNRIEDLWLAEVTLTAIGVPTLGSEVSDWKWASKAELEKMISRGDFFAYSYFGNIVK